MQKCFLCDGYADFTEKDELYKGFCKKCKNEIKSEAEINSSGIYAIKRNKKHKVILSLQEDISNLLKQKINALESKEPVSTQKSSTSFKGEPVSTQKSSTSFKGKPVSTQKSSTLFKGEPVSTQKSSITFKGEVRQLNEKEQNSSAALECPYCKLKIDRKLYFYPLVIHNCGKACFHSKCFAKLMANGEYKCPICKQNLFTSSNESQVNYLSDDDDDDSGNYF